MANYFFPTVIQQTIPNADMTALERLILTRMFDCEPHGDRLCFFTEDGPRDFIHLPAEELRAALADSSGVTSTLRDYVAARIADLDPAAREVELDLSGTSWEFFLQDILRRSHTLKYLTVVAAFTCSKMRPDGFGGSATLITADDIRSRSTHDILEDYTREFEGGDPAVA
jgi:hypothetical protein